METLRQTQGNWVSGPDRFYNRAHELRRFLEILTGGGHVHLTAQRRIGKTSLMREAARRLGDRYSCVFVDVEDAASAEDFVAALAAQLWADRKLLAKVGQVFRNVLEKTSEAVESLQVDEIAITIREGLLRGTWREKADRLMDEIAEAEPPVILFLDEVPVMVDRMLSGPNHEVTPEGRAAVDAFMSWLRRATQRHQGKIRVVVTGSIGFEPILRRVGLSATINHLAPFDLEPWPAKTAIGCLRALGNHYGLTFADGAAERMTERLGSCIPHHVQVFFGHVRDVVERDERDVCTVEDVEAAYRKRMLGPRGHVELSTYEERLSRVLPKDVLALAIDLLTEAAVTGTLHGSTVPVFLRDHDLAGAEGEASARSVLDVLEHDGYLTRDGASYAFESSLLRDWWRRRHGDTFTPASGR
ncbi:MAG: AAA family ATPase [Bacteroidota bacterium]